MEQRELGKKLFEEHRMQTNCLLNASHRSADGLVSRRGVLEKGAAAACAAAAAWAAPSTFAAAAEPAKRAAKGRIKQSIVHWCFQDYWDVEKAALVAKELGCVSVELVEPKHWDTLKKNALVCAIAPSHGFVEGMNNPRHQEKCIGLVRQAIDDCAAAAFPNVITFTGMRDGIPDDVGLENCVKAYKQVIGYAEQKKVTLCLEMLNSRVDIKMKGHPGYQGDHTDYCMEIIRRVGSPRLKLLFDIYHVQIMDGDVISRIRQYKDFIGHVHTAGNPGRRELDDQQEINYPPIIRALIEAGYDGHLGQEFIPTRDPLTGLREAVTLCDV